MTLGDALGGRKRARVHAADDDHLGAALALAKLAQQLDAVATGQAQVDRQDGGIALLQLLVELVGIDEVLAGKAERTSHVDDQLADVALVVQHDDAVRCFGRRGRVQVRHVGLGFL